MATTPLQHTTTGYARLCRLLQWTQTLLMSSLPLSKKPATPTTSEHINARGQLGDNHRNHLALVAHRIAPQQTIRKNEHTHLRLASLRHFIGIYRFNHATAVGWSWGYIPPIRVGS